MALPFTTEAVSTHQPAPSLSPDTSYLRSNIAVPTVTLGRSAAVVATNADTRIEDSLPPDATVTALPTPASVSA
jgi:hypothetical protein